MNNFFPHLTYEARCLQLNSFVDDSVSTLRSLLGDKIVYSMTQTPRSYTIKYNLVDDDLIITSTISAHFNLGSEEAKPIKVMLDVHIEEITTSSVITDWEVYQFDIDKFVEWFSALTKSWTNHIPLIALAC